MTGGSYPADEPAADRQPGPLGVGAAAGRRPPAGTRDRADRPLVERCRPDRGRRRQRRRGHDLAARRARGVHRLDLLELRLAGRPGRRPRADGPGHRRRRPMSAADHPVQQRGLLLRRGGPPSREGVLSSSRCPRTGSSTSAPTRRCAGTGARLPDPAGRLCPQPHGHADHRPGHLAAAGLRPGSDHARADAVSLSTGSCGAAGHRITSTHECTGTAALLRQPAGPRPRAPPGARCGRRGHLGGRPAVRGAAAVGLRPEAVSIQATGLDPSYFSGGWTTAGCAARSRSPRRWTTRCSPGA